MEILVAGTPDRQRLLVRHLRQALNPKFSARKLISLRVQRFDFVLISPQAPKIEGLGLGADA